MRLIIFGPQGAGKGTQGARIAEKYSVPAVSTGDIFRWAIKGSTALGNKVRSYVDEGRLVPDELTIQVVLERLAAKDCREGFLLDGFPRNLAQAKSLDVFLEDESCALDAALVLDVPDEVSMRRLTGRMACANCGRNYHVDAPPAENWTCDNCGSEVVKRADDVDEATIKARLQLYHQQTEPLKEHYRERGLLREIDGDASPDEVFERIVTALG